MTNILSEDKLLKKFEKDKKNGEMALSGQHQAAEENHAFYAGNRMYYQTGVEDKSSKAAIVFNKVKPFISAVVGFMIQLRRKPRYEARIEDSEEQTLKSEYLNNFSDYIRDNGNFDQLESQQDKEFLISGYAAIDSNINYELNPDGDIEGELITYNEVLWDPQARLKNLLDARWVMRKKKFTKDEASTLFPGVDIEELETTLSQRSENFTYNPSGGEYDKIAFNTKNAERELVVVHYYQWWEREKYYRAPNPIFEIGHIDPQMATFLLNAMEDIKNRRLEEDENEDMQEDIFSFDPRAEYIVVDKRVHSDLKVLFERFGLEVEFVDQLRKVYYTAIISDGIVLANFKSPAQDGFTIKFKTGDYDYLNNRWFGMVDALKEPARYSSKALTEILFVIASNSKGGVLYEKSAVDDPVRFEQQYATTRSSIMVNDGALSGGMIQPKAQAALPSGYENVYQISNASLSEVVGINPEFLGSSENKQVSALLEQQRINQVVTTLADYFDSITLFQKEHARLMLTFFRMLAQNSTGRLFRIIGEDGATRFTELSEDQFAQEYDIEISEAPTSASEKKERSEMMINFANNVAALGTNIYPFVIDFLPLTNAQKAELKEVMQPQPPQPSPEELALQQQLQQLALEGQQAEIGRIIADSLLKQASATEKQASAAEKMASVPKQEAETLNKNLEAEQKDLENTFLRSRTVDDFNVNI